MRTLLLCVITVFATTAAAAQTACTPAAEAGVLRNVRTAQATALAIESTDMDSGVPNQVAPVLIRLKQQLALAADFAILCTPPDATVAQMQARLDKLLQQAAPGMPAPAPAANDKDEDKPRKGIFGNRVSARVSALADTPRLLEVDLATSEACGDDTQLLIYQQTNGRWMRALRASSTFAGNDDVGQSWGDFFLAKVVIPDPAHPEDWRAVLAHGTPWCTSRFSNFGLAVLAPEIKTGESRVVWQTERDYSRGDFDPRLKASGDTFELRLNADEMSFNENAFERLVVYRYRVHDDKLTRLEPVAANSRGFVEEWLSMPWQEALDQSAAIDPTSLKKVHEQNSVPANKNEYTAWTAGPVRACSATGRFQAAFDSQHSVMGTGTTPSHDDPKIHHYFQIRQADNGYQMLSVSPTPDPTCTGPDLMRKAK